WKITSDDIATFNIEKFLDSKNRLTVKLHGGSGTYQRVSLAEIIQAIGEGENSLEYKNLLKVFNDSLVFLGATAPGLMDLRPNSLEERGAGVEFLAHVLDNLHNENFIIKIEG